MRPGAGEEDTALHRDAAFVPDRMVNLGDHGVSEAARHPREETVKGVVNLLGQRGEFENPAVAGRRRVIGRGDGKVEIGVLLLIPLAPTHPQLRKSPGS